MRSLTLKNFMRRSKHKPKPSPSPPAAGPSSATQGRFVCEGRVLVKGHFLFETWRQYWVVVRESDGWMPVLEFYDEHSTNGSRKLIDNIEVTHVRRIMTKRCTIRVESRHSGRKFNLQFATDIELYDWLEEIYSRCPGTGVVDYTTFSHDLHIRERDEAGNITGFPRTLAEYFDMYSIRSSVASGSSGREAPPPFEQSEAGLSSGDTAPLITPKSTLPIDVDIVTSDDENIIDMPRVKLPEDHIAFAPGTRVTPRIASPQHIAYGPRSWRDGRANLTKVPIPRPSSPVLNLNNRAPEHGGHSTVVYVCDLTRGIKHLSRYPVATGGFSDVYKAQIIEGGTTIAIGIKVLRQPISSPAFNKKLAKRLKREINVWHCLDHPNVVKLLGICRNLGPRPALVSLWFANGHVMRYLEDLGERATLGLKLKLLLDIANGLSYLHSFSTPVLHCDLKAANVLVSEDGVACLSDFGLSSLFENLTSSKCLSDSGALNGSVRWMAVELVCSLGEEKGFIQFTPATDIYSFGSTMLEILSGKIPYYTRRLDAHVIMDIYKGVRHRREESGVQLIYWQLMERCWADIPEERPCGSSIAEELKYYYWCQQVTELNFAGARKAKKEEETSSSRMIIDVF